MFTWWKRPCQRPAKSQPEGRQWRQPIIFSRRRNILAAKGFRDVIEIKCQLTMKTKFERQSSHRAQFAPQSATIFKHWLSSSSFTDLSTLSKTLILPLWSLHWINYHWLLCSAVSLFPPQIFLPLFFYFLLPPFFFFTGFSHKVLPQRVSPHYQVISARRCH